MPNGKGKLNMSTTIRLELNYLRPYSMLNSAPDFVNLPLVPTKNKQKIIDCIKDYFKTWTGEGDLTITHVCPNVFPNQWANNDFFESLSGRKWSFKDGKIRELNGGDGGEF